MKMQNLDTRSEQNMFSNFFHEELRLPGKIKLEPLQQGTSKEEKNWKMHLLPSRQWHGM